MVRAVHRHGPLRRHCHGARLGSDGKHQRDKGADQATHGEVPRPHADKLGSLDTSFNGLSAAGSFCGLTAIDDKTVKCLGFAQTLADGLGDTKGAIRIPKSPSRIRQLPELRRTYPARARPGV